MKTTILISSLAALCLMITFAESPTHRSAENSNTVPVNRISLVPPVSLHTFQETTLSPKTVKTPVGLTQITEADDFTYLKFKVADFIEKDDAYAESEVSTAFPEPDCSYLKFDVTDYTEGTDAGSTESVELTENDFAYLRFDAGSYTETNLEWFESMDLPADNFSYLKFDIHQYFVGSEMEEGIFGELPLTETQLYSSL